MIKERKGSFTILRVVSTAAALYACVLLWELQAGHPADSNVAMRNLREYTSQKSTSIELLSHAPLYRIKLEEKEQLDRTILATETWKRQTGVDKPKRTSTNSSPPARTPTCSQDAPPLNFTLDDIDYGRKPACGNNKCFFRSRAAPTELGYLIVDGPVFPKLQKSWEIACSLAQYGNHKHIYTGIPPVKIFVPDNASFLKQLRKIGMKEADVKKYTFRTELAVLQVRVMPPGFSEAGCQFARQARSITKLHSVLGSDPDVTHRYAEEIDKVVELLRQIPRLARDFQIMVESDGSITHFDLDRWEPKEMPREVLETCICNLKKDALLLRDHDDFVRTTVRSRRFKKLYEEHPEYFTEISECNNAATMWLEHNPGILDLAKHHEKLKRDYANLEAYVKHLEKKLDEV